MGKIVLLDELTINQIAAGEVIERPASVIKEMVENSIDAGATHINVEIKIGGISYIRISDDGKGIQRDDVEMAFERHATSKIRSAADLNEVKSMGFRGEALASIAAIANVELISRTEDEPTGTKITVEGGNILNIEEIGASKGTVITVRNLFFNTPVRYKFLKKDFTETGYIEDVMTRIALVHPEIAIKLINSGKTVIQTSGNGDLKAVIYSLFGRDTALEVLPVEYEYEYIKVSGVIGKPAIARSNRSNQIFFVNGRYIKDRTLTSAAEQGFKGMIPIGKFAFLVLNIEMNPSKVDVNVHPAKLEVRFEDEGVVFKAVYHAIKNTLLSADLISDRERNKEAKEASKDAFKIQVPEVSNDGGLFGRNENHAEEVKRANIFPDNMDVFERLRRLQEDLRNQVAENPNIQLTEDYKKMEEKYNEITEATDAIKNNAQNEQANEIRTENIQATQKFEILQDENVNKEEVKEEIFQEREGSKIQVYSEEQNTKDAEQSEEQNSEQEIQNDEVQENEQVTEKQETEQTVQVEQENKQDAIEDVNEKILSFEQMYKQLFGKEPYGGRIPVEEPNKEQESTYEIAEEDINDNISVFEDMEEYNRPTYRFIGIAFKTYIILEMNNELYIMDQHAAHERILYEKVKANFFSDGGEKESQMLLLPDIITLTPKEMNIAKDNFDLFERAGFIVEEFGENTIKLSGVPEICVDLETKELFMETLDEINTVARTAKQEKEEKFIATVACKAAVKANMALTEEEVTSLMDQLLELPNPFTCPHGRPTVIKMSKYDIERKFARK